MARAGIDRATTERRQSEGFAAERWLQRTMYPTGKVLNRRGPGDIMIPTGEVIEVKSVPVREPRFVNGGERPPKHRTIVVVTEGAESDWFVLGEIRASSWVRGHPDGVWKAQLCWYVPASAITCCREWGCDHVD